MCAASAALSIACPWTPMSTLAGRRLRPGSMQPRRLAASSTSRQCLVSRSSDPEASALPRSLRLERWLLVGPAPFSRRECDVRGEKLEEALSRPLLGAQRERLRCGDLRVDDA